MARKDYFIIQAIWSCSLNENNSMSEVYRWPKDIPGDLNLGKCSKEFESRGFHTLELLQYLRPGDIYAFFPSPEKLLLEEKRIWESDIKAIVDPKSKRTPLRPLELFQRFDSFSEMNCYAASSYDSQIWTFYRQQLQQLLATSRSLQLLAVRKINHWIERGMK